MRSAARNASAMIVMVGLGGREYRSEHLKATFEVLSSLPLDKNDLVYLSPFVLQPGTPGYGKLGGQARITPMSEAEIESDLQRLATSLRQIGVKTSRYDIREFIY